MAASCQDCGVVLDEPSRKYCHECFPDRRAESVAIFATAGPADLARRRAQGLDPAHTKEARRKQGIRARQNVQANADWEKLNADHEMELDFARDIQPGIKALPLSRIMEATGLSLRYCSLIRRGQKVPHPRHWGALVRVGAKAAMDPREGVT